MKINNKLIISYFGVLNMINKTIKQKQRGKYLTYEINLNLKDLKDLGIKETEFRSIENKKTKESNNNIIILNTEEYKQLEDKNRTDRISAKVEQLEHENNVLKDKIKEQEQNKEQVNIYETMKELLSFNSNADNKEEVQLKEHKVTTSKEYKKLQVKYDKLNSTLAEAKEQASNKEQIINQYKLIIKQYETQITVYNKLNWVSRLISNLKLDLVNYDEYKLKNSDYKVINYVPEAKKD